MFAIVQRSPYRTSISPERAAQIGATLLVLIGAALRLFGAQAHSFNVDELSVLTQSAHLGPILSSRLDSEVGWLPIQFLMLHAAQLVGQQEFMLRLPAMICGILTLPVVYRLARAMFGIKAGLIALLLLAISPFHVSYSQYIRYYSYFILASAVVFLFLYKSITSNKPWAWVGLAVSVALALRTQHIAKVLWVIQLAVGGLVIAYDLALKYITAVRLRPGIGPTVSIGPTRSRRSQALASPLVLFVLCQLLIMLLAYPYIDSIRYEAMAAISARITGSAVNTQRIAFPPPVPMANPAARLTPSTAIGLLDDLTDGKWWDKLPVHVLALFAGFWIMGIVGIFMRRQWKQALVLGFGVLIPVAAVKIMNVETAYGIDARYFSFLLPLYLIPVANGLAFLSDAVQSLSGSLRRSNKSRWSSALGPVLDVGCLAIPLLAFAAINAYSLQPLYRHEMQNWRDSIAFVRTNARPGECAIVEPAIALDFYSWPGYTPCPSGEVLQSMQEYQGGWYVRLNYGLDAAHEKRLQDAGFATVRFDGYWGDGILVSHWRAGASQADLSLDLALGAVRATPYDPSLRVDLGNVLMSSGQEEQGVLQYQAALRFRPDYQPAYMALARYFANKSQKLDLAALLNSAFAHNWLSIWPYNLRGDIAAEAGLKQTAMQDFRRAIDLNPFETWNSYWRVGELYQQAGRQTDLLALYQMATRLNPSEPWAHLALGEAWRRNGDFQKAKLEIAAAAREAPEKPEAILALANLYHAQGDFNQALELLRDEARRQASATWPLIALGDRLRDAGKLEEALAAYGEAEGRNPSDPSIRQHLAATTWNLGAHLAEARASSSSGAELVPAAGNTWARPDPDKPVVFVSPSMEPVDKQIRAGEVFIHPYSAQESTYITFTIPANPYGQLNADFGLADAVADKSDGVDYRIEVSRDGGKTFQTLIQASVAENKWRNQTVSLTSFWHQDLVFRLVSRTRGSFRYNWLITTLQLVPAGGVWNLVNNAWQSHGQCGPAELVLGPDGFKYRERLLISRSERPTQAITRPLQVEFRPCSGSVDTVWRFPIKALPFTRLQTSFGLSDAAAGHSNGVAYSVAISTTLQPSPVILFEAPNIRDRGWHHAEVDLTPYEGQDATLILTTSALGDAQYDWLQVELSMFPADSPSALMQDARKGRTAYWAPNQVPTRDTVLSRG
jgi:tetratricopeptide (TPR) repeat protein